MAQYSHQAVISIAKHEFGCPDCQSTKQGHIGEAKNSDSEK